MGRHRRTQPRNPTEENDLLKKRIAELEEELRQLREKTARRTSGRELG